MLKFPNRWQRNFKHFAKYKYILAFTNCMKAKYDVYSFCTKLSLFFNWLFIVALTARFYRDCHCFSV